MVNFNCDSSSSAQTSSNPNFINMIVMYCVALPCQESEAPHNADKVKIWSSRTPLLTQKKREEKQGNNADAVNIVAQGGQPSSCNEGQER